MEEKSTLTNRKLEIQLRRQLKTWQKTEFKMMISLFEKMVQDERIPEAWRKEGNTSLMVYVLQSVQLKLYPTSEYDKEKFQELKNVGL